MNDIDSFAHINEKDVFIETPGLPKPAIFRKRLNRFVAEIEIDGVNHLTHVPSSGRMNELLYPGAEVYVLFMPSPKRKTHFKLIMARYNGKIVSVDALLPNKLIAQALEKRAIKAFDGFGKYIRECTYKNSRFDFLLLGDNKNAYAEVKSVTLVREGLAMFPDAPSLRAKKHLRELMDAKKNGFDAYVIFVIQREDALSFRPNDLQDPEFGSLLRRCHEIRVQLIAVDCFVDKKLVMLKGILPIVL